MGDCLHIEDPTARQCVPWLADTAIQEGRAAVENPARLVDGRPQNPFGYRSPGAIISMGRRDGLSQFGQLVLSGIYGSLAWHAVHLVKITTLRDRLSTALDWSAGYVQDKDSTLLDMWPERSIAGSGRGGEAEVH